MGSDDSPGPLALTPCDLVTCYLPAIFRNLFPMVSECQCQWIQRDSEGPWNSFTHSFIPSFNKYMLDMILNPGNSAVNKTYRCLLSRSLNSSSERLTANKWTNYQSTHLNNFWWSHVLSGKQKYGTGMRKTRVVKKLLFLGEWLSQILKIRHESWKALRDVV